MSINQTTLNALIKWISASPESYHHDDMQRFFELVRIAAEHNDLMHLVNLSWNPFFDECQPEWNKKFRIKFEMEWKQIIAYFAEYIESV